MPIKKILNLIKNYFLNKQEKKRLILIAAIIVLGQGANMSRHFIVTHIIDGLTKTIPAMLEVAGPADLALGSLSFFGIKDWLARSAMITSKIPGAMSFTKMVGAISLWCTSRFVYGGFMEMQRV